MLAFRPERNEIKLSKYGMSHTVEDKSGSRQAVGSSVMNPLCRFKPVAPHAFTFDVHAPEIEEGLLMLVDAARELRFGNSVIILTL